MTCRGKYAVKAVTAHASGPKTIQSDGQMSYLGVRGMRICHNGKVLLTGGADGIVKCYNVSDGNIQVRWTACFILLLIFGIDAVFCQSGAVIFVQHGMIPHKARRPPFTLYNMLLIAGSYQMLPPARFVIALEFNCVLLNIDASFTMLQRSKIVCLERVCWFF